MKESFSALIPDGESLFSLFVAHCLAEAPNVKLYVLSKKRWSPIRFSRYCHNYTFKETGHDNDLWLDVVSDLVQKHKIDVLLPTDTQAISLAISNTDALSKFVAVVPLPDKKSFEIANNKWLFAQYLQDNQFPVPSTILVSYDDQFERRINEIEFPVLLKPAIARDGDGIEFFANRDGLRCYLGRQNPKKMEKQFIIQKFLQGTVYGINLLSRQGKLLATTAHQGIIGNTKKYAAAGATEMIKDDRFSPLVCKLVSTLKWSGFANLDTLYDNQDNKLKVLELNARFWAGVRNTMGTGINFPYMACLAALDVPFTMPDYKLVRYFHSKTALDEGLRRLLGKSRVQGMTFRETGLKYLFDDPFAEFLRAFNQEVLDRESTIESSALD